MSEKENNAKVTEIASLGKQKALAMLFVGSGYVNERAISLVADKSRSLRTVSRVMLESVDFDLTYTPLRHLGYKVALSVFGELYAGLHQPESLQIIVGVSNRFSFEDIRDLWEGIVAASKEHNVKHLSLDLVPSRSGLVISLAGTGSRKKGAEDGTAVESKDLLALSGNLGAAYMGMQILEREKVSFNESSRQPDLSKYKYVVGQYLSPSVDGGILKRLEDAGITPKCGCFITHGLGAAVKTMAAETGLGVKIYLEKIPISSNTFEVAEELNFDAVTAAMNGGDDYRLLFTIPLSMHEKFRHEMQNYDIIGHFAQSEVGTVLVTPDGAEIGIKAQGFE